ncbi:MAG: sterol desaturase family protein [Deltaproteobacteria bacterium]|nr:sterol desaturase family protein [Deltaproteobacteria bacterium]
MQAWTVQLATFGLGAAGWTFAEYVLHRFVFHGASAKRLGAGEHRRHHAQVDYFAPWWQKGLAALAAMSLILPLAIFVGSGASGVAFTLGFVAMYLTYEVLHRRAHTHPPRGPYGRWLRHNHFAHHFADPRLAQGVTTPIWDVVFSTRLPVEKVRVPRRLALPWLVDGGGEIWPAFAGDYELVGRRNSDANTRRSDAEAANENRSPSTGTDG